SFVLDCALELVIWSFHFRPWVRFVQKSFSLPSPPLKFERQPGRYTNTSACAHHFAIDAFSKTQIAKEPAACAATRPCAVRYYVGRTGGVRPFLSQKSLEERSPNVAPHHLSRLAHYHRIGPQRTERQRGTENRDQRRTDHFDVVAA